MDNYDKYIKYKKKYLNLKKLIGGNLKLTQDFQTDVKQIAFSNLVNF